MSHESQCVCFLGAYTSVREEGQLSNIKIAPRPGQPWSHGTVKQFACLPFWNSNIWTKVLTFRRGVEQTASMIKAKDTRKKMYKISHRCGDQQIFIVHDPAYLPAYWMCILVSLRESPSLTRSSFVQWHLTAPCKLPWILRGKRGGCNESHMTLHIGVPQHKGSVKCY